ncbi:MAG: SDR family oxidoreductase [Actinomycetota bacterium]
MGTVEDQVVIVTGGASGIGACLCRSFAAAGARTVVVVDRDAEGSAAVAAEVGGVSVELDLGDGDAVTEAFTAIEDEHGPVDVLCNNAGIASGADPLTTPLDEWQLQWDVNVMSHVHALRAVLPGMLARGEGRVLHTASMAGILSSHGNAVYATTKHAVVGLAEWLAFTYAHRGLKVHLLAPLGVNTPMLAATADPEWQRSAAGEVVEPEDVAEMVLDAFREERFLITTDDVAQEWMTFKTAEPDKWLRGMGKLQQRIEAADGSAATG